MKASSFLGGRQDLDPIALQQIGNEIAQVEVELALHVRSQVRLVSDVGAHVLQAGGKRLRPAFLILAAQAVGNSFESNRARKLAACMEMIHMATLIHDDVIDHAETRRGRTTANATFGNTASILTGDVLLSKAMSILAQDGDLEIIRTVSAAVVELAEGEVRELETRGRFDLPIEDHLAILRMKTASFIQCCCETGARVAGASDETRQALGAYGHHIGMAFQLVDDILDYKGSQEKTGKAVATDFREGCSTLPLIHLLPSLGSEEAREVESWFGNGVSDGNVKTLIAWMESRGAFERTEAVALHHIEQAKTCLQVLDSSSSRALLETAADFVLLRNS